MTDKQGAASDVGRTLCRLAAELADEIEQKDEHGCGTLRLEYEFIADPYGPHGITYPTTIRVEAHWLGGEWKFTERTLRENLTSERPPRST
jgi:hypothetical protein